VAAASRQRDDVVHHRRGTLLIGLDDEADAVPARQGRLVAQALEQVEREFEPLAFLGVDMQADIHGTRGLRQRQQARVELLHDASILRAAVARVQGRQLDRHAGGVDDASARVGRADRVDRVAVGLEIALCVPGGQRRFAQHVVGVAKALRFAPLRTAQGAFDRLAHDELFAHQAHG
jgi:hypothetical protein